MSDCFHFRIFFPASFTVTLQTHALDDSFDQHLCLLPFDFDRKHLNNAQSKSSDLKEQYSAGP